MTTKDRRLQLQSELVGILGSEEVYFQPPMSVKMQYPAIVYKRVNGTTTFADNLSYLHRKRYSITVIDKDPDSDIADRIIQHFQTCLYDRRFTADNLNHDVINLFY